MSYILIIVWVFSATSPSFKSIPVTSAVVQVEFNTAEACQKAAAKLVAQTPQNAPAVWACSPKGEKGAKP